MLNGYCNHIHVLKGKHEYIDKRNGRYKKELHEAFRTEKCIWYEKLYGVNSRLDPGKNYHWT